MTLHISRCEDILINRLCVNRETVDKAMSLYDSLKNREPFKHSSIPVICAHIASEILDNGYVSRKAAREASRLNDEDFSASLKAVRRDLAFYGPTISYGSLIRTYELPNKEFFLSWMRTVERKLESARHDFFLCDTVIFAVFYWICNILEIHKVKATDLKKDCGVRAALFDTCIIRLRQFEPISHDISSGWKMLRPVEPCAISVQDTPEGKTAVPVMTTVKHEMATSSSNLHTPGRRSPVNISKWSMSLLSGSPHSSTALRANSSSVSQDTKPLPRRKTETHNTSSQNVALKYCSSEDEDDPQPLKRKRELDSPDISHLPAPRSNPARTLSREAPPHAPSLASKSSAHLEVSSPTSSPHTGNSGNTPPFTLPPRPSQSLPLPRGRTNLRPKSSSNNPALSQVTSEPSSESTVPHLPAPSVDLRTPEQSTSPPSPVRTTTPPCVTSLPASTLPTSEPSMKQKLAEHLQKAARDMISYVVNVGCSDIDLKFKILDYNTRLFELERLNAAFPTTLGSERSSSDGSSTNTAEWSAMVVKVGSAIEQAQDEIVRYVRNTQCRDIDLKFKVLDFDTRLSEWKRFSGAVTLTELGSVSVT